MGFAAAGKCDGLGFERYLSQKRAQLSPRHCGCRSPRDTDESAGDGPLSHDLSGIRTEISHHARGNQNLAGSIADRPCAKRNRYSEEPYTQSCRAAFYRARTRARKAASEAKMIGAIVAPFGPSLTLRNYVGGWGRSRRGADLANGWG